MTHSNQETQYFNNSTSSACYINEIKRIEVKRGRGEPFIAIKAALLDGPMDDPTYEDIDLIVKGPQAKQVLEAFEAHWPTYSQENRPTVFANIRFGSIGVKPYLTNDKKPAAVLSGRLIKVTYLSVNKEVVFQENQNEQPATFQETPVADTAPTETSDMHVKNPSVTNEPVPVQQHAVA